MQKLILGLALLGQLFLSSAHAQTQDGECLVPLDASKFADFIVDDAGLDEAADFAISAPLMSVSPVADAVIGAGEYANACFFTFAENENPGQSWPNLDNLDDGDEDLTVKMHFAHTDAFLFVAFEVTDDYLDLDYPANSFQNDGVELFINPDLDVGDPWGTGRFQVYVDAAGDGDIEFNNRGATAGIVPITTNDSPPGEGEFYSAGLPTDTGYIVEFQIPLESMNTTGDDFDWVPATTGDFLLINAAIDDNDEDDDPGAQTGHHVLWHVDGAGSPFGGGEAIWPVALELSDAVTSTAGDANGDGTVNGADIDATAAAISANDVGGNFDHNSDGSVNTDDHTFLVEDILNTYFGDANLDGEFNSGDFVTVFQEGLYESGNAALWGQGDWNGDGFFDSGDFVAAFQSGGYEIGPRMAASSVPEPSTAVLASLGLGALLGLARRRR